MKQTVGAGIFLSMIFIVGLVVMPGNTATGQGTLQAVSSVDLNRYMGDWYEIARTPNRYESDCASDASAHYQLLPDGRVAIKNECRTSRGKTRTAQGKGTVADQDSKAKLKVSFFWPFSGDYWIIDLDKDYRYAVVGEPERKNLWVLSRKPNLDQRTYDEILKHIQAQGYDISRVQKTTQSSAVSLVAEPKTNVPEAKAAVPAGKRHVAASKLN